MADILDILRAFQASGIDLEQFKGKIPGVIAALSGQQLRSDTALERMQLASRLGMSEAEQANIFKQALVEQKGNIDLRELTTKLGMSAEQAMNLQRMKQDHDLAMLNAGSQADIAKAREMAALKAAEAQNASLLGRDNLTHKVDAETAQKLDLNAATHAQTLERLREEAALGTDSKLRVGDQELNAKLATMREKATLDANAAMRNAAAQVFIPNEIGSAVMRASTMAQSLLTPEGSPAIQQELSRLDAMGEAGKAAADGVRAIMNRNLQAETMRQMDIIEQTLRASGAQIADREQLEKTISSRLERNIPTNLTDEATRQQETHERNRRATETTERIFRQSRPAPTPDDLRSRLASAATPAEFDRIATEAEGAVAAGERSARNRRRGLVGAIGGGVAALLLSKMIGKKEADALPPEVQMALLSKFQGAGGGGGSAAGGASDDPEVGTGRSLLNMQRAVGLLKAMQSMAATNEAAGAPTVAQLI